MTCCDLIRTWCIHQSACRVSLYISKSESCKNQFVKMSSKVLFSNSNEICSLIESLSRWKVTYLDRMDLPEGTGDLLVFDILFYQLPDREWTVDELLEKRPEWEHQVLPLLKAKHYAYLFTNMEWCLMMYVKELDRIYFRETPRGVGGTRVFLGHGVLDLHDVTRDQGSERTRQVHV